MDDRNEQGEAWFDDAIASSSKAFEELGLDARIRPLGLHGATVECRLTVEDRLVGTGLGSGGGREAVARAMLAALEQHVIGQGRCDAEQLSADPLVLADEPAMEPELSVRNLLHIRRERALSGNCTGRIALRTYTDIETGERVRVPLFISMPGVAEAGHDGFDCTELRHHVSNRGTRAGLSGELAVADALDALVGDDALALACIAAQRENTVDVMTGIVASSLPNQLQESLAIAESELNRTIRLVDATTNLGIPVVLAVPVTRTSSPLLVGVGVSIDPGQAISRALFDLRRSGQVQDREIDGLWELAAALDANAIRWQSHQKFLSVRRQALGQAGSMTMSQQLFQHDLRVLVSKTAEFDAGLTMVDVRVPGLERTRLIDSPADWRLGDRGLDALHRSRGHAHRAAS